MRGIGCGVINRSLAWQLGLLLNKSKIRNPTAKKIKFLLKKLWRFTQEMPRCTILYYAPQSEPRNMCSTACTHAFLHKFRLFWPHELYMYIIARLSTSVWIDYRCCNTNYCITLRKGRLLYTFENAGFITEVGRSKALTCVWLWGAWFQGWSLFCWIESYVFNSHPGWCFCKA